MTQSEPMRVALKMFNRTIQSTPKLGARGIASNKTGLLRTNSWVTKMAEHQPGGLAGGLPPQGIGLPEYEAPQKQ